MEVRCDGGSGVRRRLAITAWGSSRLCGGADEGGEDLLGVSAAPGAIAGTEFAGDDSGADGLFGAPIGGIDGGVGQEAERRSPFGAEVVGEASNVGEWPWTDDALARGAANTARAWLLEAGEGVPARSSSRRPRACWNAV